MNISFEGIGYLAVTFPAAEDAAGQVCELNADGGVKACSDGNSFIGVMEFVRDGRAAVQVEGFAEVSYTGTNLSLGYTKLTGNGSGGVQLDSDGREYLVVQVNTADKTAVIKL